MCSKLTETAADDLLAFVRRARRYAVEAQTHGGHERALDTLGEDARHLLDKHGLLTMADDPEVARVFMEEALEHYEKDTNYDPCPPKGVRPVFNEHAEFTLLGKGNPMEMDPNFTSCDLPGCNLRAEPRFGYCCSPEHQREMEMSCASLHRSFFWEGERVTLDCVGGLATDPRLDPGTPAEGQRIAHGAQGVVDCAGTHNVGVVWDGYEGSVRVPASMLRRE